MAVELVLDGAIADGDGDVGLAAPGLAMEMSERQSMTKSGEGAEQNATQILSGA